MLLGQVIGNIGKDAEVKNINGKDYLSFSVASTEKNGEHETTTWVSVLASNSPNLLPYLKKGQQVFVSGKMAAKIFQSQQSVGIDISLFASSLQLCGTKKDETAPSVNQPGIPKATTTSTSAVPPQNNSEEDLPF